MNDCSVHQVSLDTVLRQRAYILFYQKTAVKGTSETKKIDLSTSTSIPVAPVAVKRSMEEKMAAVREASRVYTEKSQSQSQPQSKAAEIESVDIENESADSDSVKSDSDSIESVPMLCSVSSSTHPSLRASSMWHMTPLTESFNTHTPTASKIIKFNFSTEWQVSKL